MNKLNCKYARVKTCKLEKDFIEYFDLVDFKNTNLFIPFKLITLHHPNKRFIKKLFRSKIVILAQVKSVRLKDPEKCFHPRFLHLN